MIPQSLKIRQAEFVKSETNLKRLPPADRPEYAFVGRSNVGKSSLINYLCGRKDLAKTGATPGKTRALNYYSINGDSWYLVDMPGYGYAQTSKTQRRVFQQLITDYLTQRFSLVHTFLLIDIRHPAMAIDLDFIQFLGESELSFSIVFTKADKVGPNAGVMRKEAYQKILSETWEEPPPMYLTSAQAGRGAEEILAAIHEYNRVSRDAIRKAYDYSQAVKK
jgi:GTP-binding protein